MWTEMSVYKEFKRYAAETIDRGLRSVAIRFNRTVA